MGELDAGLAEIEAALVAFERVLTPEAPADVAGFVQERVRLARAVNAYLAAERIRIGALAAHDAADDGQGGVYKLLVDLRLHYSSHIATWNNQTVLAAWPAYRRESMRLIEQMRRILAARRAARLAA